MATLLMCPPDFYGIEYEINPWMSQRRSASPEQSRTQWQQLRDTLIGIGCRVDQIEPRPKLPDMVFTANAGLVIGNRFMRSNFRYKERRGESVHFERWFAQHGYEVVPLPERLYFEGEGDALFCGDILFCGYRFRSDIQSHQAIGDLLGCLTISVELADERFYHLDTCFCPLADGAAVWYPAAFDPYGRRAIQQHVRELIEVSPEEALRFACNAVVHGSDIVLADGCPLLAAALSGRGFHVHPLPMGEFIKAGGACKCLTLFLPAQ